MYAVMDFETAVIKDDKYIIQKRIQDNGYSSDDIIRFKVKYFSDTLLKKDGFLFFCQKISDANIVE